MVSATIIGAIVVAVLAAGIGAAYSSGALDPLIQQLGMMFFKAKAQAEKKKLQAQGMKEGQDFMNDQLKGNQQAGQAAEGLRNMGGGVGTGASDLGSSMGSNMGKRF